MTKHSEVPNWDYEQTKNMLLGIRHPLARDYSILAYCYGARLNEALSVKPIDFSLVETDKGPKLFLNLVTLKNPHLERRFIPMNPSAEAWYFPTLQRMMQKQPREENYFHYGDRWIKKVVKRPFPLGLGIHSHSLRHLRIRHDNNHSIPARGALTVAQYKYFYGWAKFETAAHYQGKLDPFSLKEVI